MNYRCNICKGKLLLHRSQIPDTVTGQRFDIYRCTACELGQTVPAPLGMRPYYPSNYYGNRHGFTARHCFQRRPGWLLGVTGPPRSKTLLDVGCGDGSFLRYAETAGFRVFGTEIEPREARASGLDVRTRLREFQGHPPFDGITMWHSLEHMANPRRVLENATSLLSHSGILLVAVPDNGGLQASLFGRHWVHLDVPRHLYHFSRESLTSALKQNGLSIDRTWHQEIEYDLFGWSQSVLNAVSSRPNIFFNWLTGKKDDSSGLHRTLYGLAGSLLAGMALPALAAGTMTSGGGH